jgi:4-amino-4-deoxy-L-arabinose transferase-like glycosyltransferase
MEPEDTPRPKRLHFALLLLLSFLIFLVGFAFEQALRWSNHLDGLLSGLVQSGILGVAWCLIYVLPWSLIIFGLYRWRRWWRFRTQWILAPSILIAILSIGSLLTNPQSPSNRFKRFAKTNLPANAQDLHFHFTGGGFADYGDTYFFRTTPSEVDRLISDLRLSEDEFYGQEGMSHAIVSPFSDCPDFSSWKGGKQFKGWDERQRWFYYLITDSTRTQVYVMIGCI